MRIQEQSNLGSYESALVLDYWRMIINGEVFKPEVSKRNVIQFLPTQDQHRLIQSLCCNPVGHTKLMGVFQWLYCFFPSSQATGPYEGSVAKRPLHIDRARRFAQRAIAIHGAIAFRLRPPSLNISEGRLSPCEWRLTTRKRWGASNWLLRIFTTEPPSCLNGSSRGVHLGHGRISKTLLMSRSICRVLNAPTPTNTPLSQNTEPSASKTGRISVAEVTQTFRSMRAGAVKGMQGQRPKAAWAYPYHCFGIQQALPSWWGGWYAR